MPGAVSASLANGAESSRSASEASRASDAADMAGPTLLRRLRTFLAGATGGAGFTNAVPAEAGSIFSLLRSMMAEVVEGAGSLCFV